jgi:hypothetical protein
MERLEPRMQLSGAADTPVTPDDLQDYLVNEWQSGTTYVAIYDIDGSMDIDPSAVKVTFAKDVVTSIAVASDTPLTGLGIAISGAKSVGTITCKQGGTNLAFIVSNATIRSVVLAGGVTGCLLNGLGVGGLQLDQDLDGDGNMADTTAIWCSQALSSISLGGTATGDISAASVGTVTVKNGDLGEVRSAGSIGNISVVGGNLTGSVVAAAGTVGNITVTGVATWQADPEIPQLGQGSVVGGNITSPAIHANAVKGKSIGNITLTAGSLGSLNQPVDIRAVDANGDTVAGGIGNIVVKNLRFKESATQEEQEVLDAWGEPKLDRNGDPIVRTVRTTTYAYAGGGEWMTLDTLGKVGNLATSGGDLGGTIHAAQGIGDVKVESIVLHKLGTVMGVPYTDTEDDLARGDMAAALSAEPGADAVAIKSISVLGGDLSGDVDVTGKVGAITTKCIGIYAQYGLMAAGGSTTPGRTVKRWGGTLALEGGSLSCESFHSSSLGNVALSGGDLSGAITVDGSVGTVTVLLGGISGSLTATEGSVGNITIKGVPSDVVDLESVVLSGTVVAGQSIGNVTVEGGGFTGSLTASAGSVGNLTVKAYLAGLSDPQPVEVSGAVSAGTSIGQIQVEGGNFTSSLTARNAIGNITVKVLTANATARWVRENVDGEVFWDCQYTPGIALGGTFQATIALGGTAEDLNPAAKMGAICGVGVEVTLEGTIPWDSAGMRVACKPVTYTDTATGEEIYNDNGDVTGRKVNKTTARLPGEDDVVNYMHNNLALPSA